MATTNLQLGIDLCQTNNCKVLKLSETTGAYDSLTNQGGWDSTFTNNPTIYDVDDPSANKVTIFTIEITLPDTTSYTVVDEDYIYGTSTFPTTGENTLDFNGSDFGGTSSDSLTDGIYTVTYTVIGLFQSQEYTATTTSKFLLTCQTRCCIDKLFNLAAQTMDCDSCKKDKLNKALEAEAYLKSAQYAAECGKLNLATQLLNKAKWICTNQNCNNC